MTEQRRQRDGALERFFGRPGSQRLAVTIAHQMTRVGHVAGMSAIGYTQKEDCVEVSGVSLQITACARVRCASGTV